MFLSSLPVTGKEVFYIVLSSYLCSSIKNFFLSHLRIGMS